MITVITAWYNEEFLAPLFLKHYSFADRIVILLDESTDDDTVAVVDLFKNHYSNKFTNIDIKVLEMPDGMDDKLKQKQINAEYRLVTDGWVIIADADEFINIPQGGLLHYLSNVSADVVKVDYFQMYQHESEGLLNRFVPVFQQRRYGKRNGFARWQKPAVVRAGKNFKWSVGHHEINAVHEQYHSKMLLGAHLYMADINLAVKRRILGRKNRMSQENRKDRLSAHNFDITEQDIISTCNENKNCPMVFE